MNFTVVSRVLVVLAVLALLAACSTPQAPGVRGRWKPVNGFAQSPEAIPLQQAYLFRALPADATLKNMLSRWARDRKMSLSYLHANDYTLYEPVARIQTSDINAAVSALNYAYAAQGVVVVVGNNQIVVRAAAASGEAEG